MSPFTAFVLAYLYHSHVREGEACWKEPKIQIKGKGKQQQNETNLQFRQIGLQGTK